MGKPTFDNTYSEAGLPVPVCPGSDYVLSDEGISP